METDTHTNIDIRTNVITKKLQDVFIQQYRAYLVILEANSNKCHLAKPCDKGVYNMSHYLSNVKSPQIRSIISNYTLDVNNAQEHAHDSKDRSFRFINIASNLCRFCNVRRVSDIYC